MICNEVVIQNILLNSFIFVVLRMSFTHINHLLAY